MKVENLWSISTNEEDENLTTNIKDVLQQESAYLKLATQGKVFGKFRVIKKTQSVEGIASLMSTVFAAPEIEDEDTKGLLNADELYVEKNYCYEIYNKSYKFRLFEMVMPPIYPIRLIPDEGIWEDEQSDLKDSVSTFNDKKNELQIESDSMLMDVLRVIFQSKKVRFIIRRMQELPDT